MDENSLKLPFFSAFYALPINLTPLLLGCLYFRPYKYRSCHSITTNTKDSTQNEVNQERDYRTIYVRNLWPGCSEKDLIDIFGQCGLIEEIILGSEDLDGSDNANLLSGLNSAMTNILQNKAPINIGNLDHAPAPSQLKFLQLELEKLQRNIIDEFEPSKHSECALIVFGDVESFEFAIRDLNIMSVYGKFNSIRKTESLAIKSYLDEWRRKYIIDENQLQAKADIELAKYDYNVNKKRKIEDQLATTEDAEGWTVVAPRGHKRALGGAGLTVSTATISQKALLNRKIAQDRRLVKNDFYLFQLQKGDDSKLQNLQYKLNTDKKTSMKIYRKSRRFRPE
ncbi:uncharacterized protein LOC126324518 [Schistocerca gregaria]|uniref:uncharacterized protein LOC126324518 n=1 Tax=Schistocerca gregaria TaxID=7010 RepID=UPI00211E668E|nr:uncharacterized protein LOC126324518 [Schistocerca gregaria]